MGGVPPLGYDPPLDPKVRALALNPDEAETVRTLFALCDQGMGLAVVEREAAALGLRSKRHLFRSGRAQGGNLLSRGQIHKILTNPVYIGKIRHKDRVWPGQHPAIIDQALWDRVQAQLQAASGRPRGRSGQAGTDPDPSPLRGKLRDETGDRLTPTHTVRKGKALRYYISNRLIRGGPDATGWRLPAGTLETLVRRLIADHLATAAASHRLLATPDLRGDQGVHAGVQDLVRALQGDDPAPLRALLQSGSIGTGSLALTLDRSALADRLGIAGKCLAPEAMSLSAPLSLRRRGVEQKLMAGPRAATPNTALRKALADAHRWARSLRSGTPLHDVARAAGHHAAHLRTRTPLAFLSPRIQRAIVEGTQPVDLTLERLVRQTLPLDWTDQERLCGL
jgi:hypothetical protein